MTVRLKSVAKNVVVKALGERMPFIGLDDLESGTGHLLAKEPEVKAAPDSVWYQPGDVLFSRLRPYLAKSYLPSRTGTGTGELLVLRPQTELDPPFLFYITLSAPWLAWADATSYGTKMPRTSWEALSEYQLWLPALDEQRRIADFLDDETARIELIASVRRRQLDLLSERLRVRFDLLFDSDQATTKRMKYLLAQRPHYGVLKPDLLDSDSGVPFVRVNDLLDLPGRIGRLPRIPLEQSQQYSRTIVREGDVLLSVVGTMGRSAIAPRELAGANIARAVASLRVRQGVSSRLRSYSARVNVVAVTVGMVASAARVDPQLPRCRSCRACPSLSRLRPPPCRSTGCARRCCASVRSSPSFGR